CTSRPPSTSQLGFQRRCSSSVRPVSAAAERPVPTAGLGSGAGSGRAGPLGADECLGAEVLTIFETLAESASRSRPFSGLTGGAGFTAGSFSARLVGFGDGGGRAGGRWRFA